MGKFCGISLERFFLKCTRSGKAHWVWKWEGIEDAHTCYSCLDARPDTDGNWLSSGEQRGPSKCCCCCIWLDKCLFADKTEYNNNEVSRLLDDEQTRSLQTKAQQLQDGFCGLRPMKFDEVT